MIRTIWAVLLWGLSVGIAFGQPYLYLKTRTVDPLDPASQLGSAPPRIQALSSSGQSHLLVQFDAPPPPEVRAEMELRGARILDYVPDNSLLVNAPPDLSLDGLGVRWSGPMRPEDKLSPQIDQDSFIGTLMGMGDFLVAFHRDVPHNSARALVASMGIELRDNPDLAPDQVLIRSSAEGVVALSGWDEVAYIFPASEALSAGRITQPCGGAVTTSGPVGQYTARVGEGWDGPGLGSAQLNYVISQMTAQIPADQAKVEIVRALAEWSRVAGVNFNAGSNPNASRTINILFASGSHGDDYPFDGQGRVLAHTFYPAPGNPEPLAGDMHFDDAERWRIGADIDLYSVALHELGHALGLGHSDKPGAVMYPYYARATALTLEDVTAILNLYARPGTTPESSSPVTLTINQTASSTTVATVAVGGTARGGTAPLSVRWASDRGDAGTAAGSISWTATLNLQPGDNAVTFTATDALQRAATQSVSINRAQSVESPISLQVTSPSSIGNVTTTSSSVTIAGIASDHSGIAQIAWRSSRGVSGISAGTANWSTGPLALAPGLTTFTLRATARSGTFIERNVAVTYQPPSASPDITPPTINILYPVSTYVYTAAATMAFTGTASDNTGVTLVRWSTNTAKSGTASGTANWSASIPLISGANNVKIEALDAAGNTAWRTVVVVRN